MLSAQYKKRQNLIIASKSELEKQMEEELEEIEELERSLAKAEQTNERQKMELKRLQERTRRDQRNVVEMEKSLYVSLASTLLGRAAHINGFDIGKMAFAANASRFQ